VSFFPEGGFQAVVPELASSSPLGYTLMQSTGVKFNNSKRYDIS
jgi:hypothetical protein